MSLVRVNKLQPFTTDDITLVSGSLIGTASFAVTASYAENAGGGAGFPFSGSAIVTGSLEATETIKAPAYLNVRNVKVPITISGSDAFTVEELNVSQSFDIEDGVKFSIFGEFENFSKKQANQYNGDQIITGSVTATSFIGDGSGLTNISVEVDNVDSASFSQTSISSSFATNAITASFAQSSPSEFPYTGTAEIDGKLSITGSAVGQVSSISLSSSTASINLSANSFFTVTLQGGDNHFNITNPQPGSTANILVTTTGSASASFSDNVKQVSESLYTPTQADSKDILTFVSFDNSTVYLANVKNLV